MAEISSSAYRSLPDIDLIDKTIEQLTAIGILRADDAIVEKNVVKIDPAYVIFDKFHSVSVRAVREYLRSRSIVTCGRFGEWEYFNMDQTILSGKRAAEDAETM
jgi:UDP-galactopyranose mutase